MLNCKLAHAVMLCAVEATCTCAIVCGTRLQSVCAPAQQNNTDCAQCWRHISSVAARTIWRAVHSVILGHTAAATLAAAEEEGRDQKGKRCYHASDDAGDAAAVAAATAA